MPDLRIIGDRRADARATGCLMKVAWMYSHWRSIAPGRSTVWRVWREELGDTGKKGSPRDIGYHTGRRGRTQNPICGIGQRVDEKVVYSLTCSGSVGRAGKMPKDEQTGRDRTLPAFYSNHTGPGCREG